MVDLNLRGLMYVTKAAPPHLVAAAAGGRRNVADLVNVSSIAGRFANRNVAIYNAVKSGGTVASEAWRQDFPPHGVRVSVAEPGVVDTELFGPPEGAGIGALRTPLRRHRAAAPPPTSRTSSR